MATAMELYEAARDRVRQARKEAQEVAKTAFSECCRSLFQSHPEVTELRWTQYTPYFNDGEECIFGVNDLYVNRHQYSSYRKEGGEPYCYTWNDNYGDSSEEKHVKPSIEAYDEAVAIRDIFSEEDLKEMFGDHCKVIVTPQGVDVEEYNHD